MCIRYVTSVLLPGDNRLGSMETGTALVRAMIQVMQLSKTNKIHLINMSYGEHAHFSSSGYVSYFPSLYCVLSVQQMSV
jgi:hypothetical protein